MTGDRPALETHTETEWAVAAVIAVALRRQGSIMVADDDEFAEVYCAGPMDLVAVASDLCRRFARLDLSTQVPRSLVRELETEVAHQFRELYT